MPSRRSVLFLPHLVSVGYTDGTRLSDCSTFMPASSKPEHCCRSLRRSKARRSSLRILSPNRFGPEGKSGGLEPLVLLRYRSQNLRRKPLLRRRGESRRGRP